MSKLYFRYGAMNSGKSTALIQVAHNYESKNMRVYVIKPEADTKHPEVLSRLNITRAIDKEIAPSDNVESIVLTETTTNPITCVLVDEAQFLTGAQIEDLFTIAVIHKIPVIAFGIRTDFRGISFEGSKRLLELAHELQELRTICYCGKRAVMNARLINGEYVKEGSQVEIDNSLTVEYDTLCGACYIRKVGPLH